MNRNEEFFDMLNILSLVLGYENLQENRQQSRHNDVQAANSSQAEYLLNEINKRFDEQNKILEEQNTILNKLLNKVEENNWVGEDL